MINLNIFVNISIKINQINIIVNSNNNPNPVFSKKFDLDNLIKHNEFELVLKKIILEIEKKLNTSVNKLYLMIEDHQLNSIDISINENFENNAITKTSIEYLLQDLRQQIITNHADKRIVHIIIKKCKLDNEEYNNIPFGNKCRNFFLEISFIYLKKNFVSNFEDLLKQHQIEVSRIICTNYARSLLDIDFDDLSKAGIAAIDNNNINEDNVFSKKINKLGFFEKLFQIFS